MLRTALRGLETVAYYAVMFYLLTLCALIMGSPLIVLVAWLVLH